MKTSNAKIMNPSKLGVQVPILATVLAFAFPGGAKSETVSAPALDPEVAAVAELTRDNADSVRTCIRELVEGDMHPVVGVMDRYERKVSLPSGQQCTIAYSDKIKGWQPMTYEDCFDPDDPEVEKRKKALTDSGREPLYPDRKVGPTDTISTDCKKPNQYFYNSGLTGSVDRITVYGKGIPRGKWVETEAFPNRIFTPEQLKKIDRMYREKVAEIGRQIRSELRQDTMKN